MITYEEFERAFNQGWILNVDDSIHLKLDEGKLLFNKPKWKSDTWLDYGTTVRGLYDLLDGVSSLYYSWISQSRRYA